MAGEVGTGLGAAATLVLGGFGAIAAIYLKEAVQAAMQRRVIVWQLFGYLMSWRAQIAKNGHFASLYEKIKQRNLALNAAMSKGSAEVRRLLESQIKETTDMREQVKMALKEALSKQDAAPLVTPYFKLLSTEASAFSTDWRKQLIESKTFISDRDAATLGKAVAMNVIQFRSSMLMLSANFEALLKLVQAESEGKAESIASTVDDMIVRGEEALIAFVRLERNVDAISAKSPAALTWDILRGK